MAKPTKYLIVDGKISKEILNQIDKDNKWALEKANVKSKKDLKNIILAQYDKENDDLIIHYKNVNETSGFVIFLNMLNCRFYYHL